MVLTTPILAGRLIQLFVSQHFTGETSGSYYDDVAWIWSMPSVYLLGTLAAGVALEAIPVLARRPLRFHAAGIVLLGLFAVVSIGGWLVEPAAADDLLYVAIGIGAILPPLAILGLLGDTARAGSLSLKAPLVLALASVLLLLAGAVAGAVQVIEPLELMGTSWQAGQVHLVLLGGCGLAAFAALWFWAPKIWGTHLPEKAGYLVALLLLGGAVLLAAPDLVAGLSEDLPRGASEWESDTVDATNGIGLAGAALSTLGALVGVAAVAGAARRRNVPAVDDPWGGFTLEWATTSPPPAANFVDVPVVESATPLLAEEAR
jgi:heme/copper-type cytochrome/quinol oxidase subunit 1